MEQSKKFRAVVVVLDDTKQSFTKEETVGGQMLFGDPGQRNRPTVRFVAYASTFSISFSFSSREELETALREFVTLVLH